MIKIGIRNNKGGVKITPPTLSFILKFSSSEMFYRYLPLFFENSVSPHSRIVKFPMET